jgi:chemotaxis protein methyltransferase CheR
VVVETNPGRTESAPQRVAGLRAAAPELTDEEFELFSRLIRDSAGIHLTPVKRALVAGRLSKRVRALGYPSFRAYFDWLECAGSNPQARSERQLAIDLLTTNETYFFREPKQFDFLREDILPQWGQRSVRLWSAACSSGEEAYSLAMILAVDGRCQWHIEGTDISTRMVARAKEGIYPIEAAAKIPERYLKACCLKGIGSRTGQFRIDGALRSRVSFRVGNLRHDQSCLGMFDLVMLRNCLIYFDQSVKREVLGRVVARIRPGGWLMVGHSESLNGMLPELETVRPAIYRKAGET